MDRIFVTFAGLRQIANDCTNISANVGRINADFQRVISQLDWEVRGQADINNTASRIGRSIDGCALALRDYTRFVAEAHDRYAQLESWGVPGAVRVSGIAEGKTSTSILDFIRSKGGLAVGSSVFLGGAVGVLGFNRLAQAKAGAVAIGKIGAVNKLGFNSTGMKTGATVGGSWLKPTTNVLKWTEKGAGAIFNVPTGLIAGAGVASKVTARAQEALWGKISANLNIMRHPTKSHLVTISQKTANGRAVTGINARIISQKKLLQSPEILKAKTGVQKAQNFANKAQSASKSKLAGIVGKVGTGLAVGIGGISVVSGIVGDVRSGVTGSRVAGNAVAETAFQAGRIGSVKAVGKIGAKGGAIGGAKVGALIGSIIPGAGTVIGAAVGGVIGGIVGGVGAGLATGWAYDRLVTPVRDAVSNVVTGAINVGTNVVQGAAKAATTAVNTVVNVGTNVVNGAANATRSVVNSVGRLFRR